MEHLQYMQRTGREPTGSPRRIALLSQTCAGAVTYNLQELYSKPVYNLHIISTDTWWKGGGGITVLSHHP